LRYLKHDYNSNTADPYCSDVEKVCILFSPVIFDLEQLEEAGLVDKNLSGAAKHSRLKGLLNPISIAGGLDNPLVDVEYKGRQSNVILTTQGESTLKIFGE